MKKIIPIILTFILTLFCSGPSFAQEKAEATKKIYVFYMETDTSYILEDPEPADFNGMKCIKGRHVNLTWVKNRIVYVPLDKISNIVEYDSLENYKKSVEMFHQKRMDSD